MTEVVYVEETCFESSSAASVLVVAHRTVVTPALLDALRERAEWDEVRFHLLVPSWAATAAARRHKLDDAELVLELALPLIEAATGSEVDGSWSARADAMDAIEDALRRRHFDEIVLSTATRRLSRRLHVDLPRRVAHLGLPVTAVMADERVPARVA
jgi:hypothetical protein